MKVLSVRPSNLVCGQWAGTGIATETGTGFWGSGFRRETERHFLKLVMFCWDCTLAKSWIEGGKSQ